MLAEAAETLWNISGELKTINNFEMMKDKKVSVSDDNLTNGGDTEDDDIFEVELPFDVLKSTLKLNFECCKKKKSVV